jgi:hypothetical protein
MASGVCALLVPQKWHKFDADQLYFTVSRTCTMMLALPSPSRETRPGIAPGIAATASLLAVLPAHRSPNAAAAMV